MLRPSFLFASALAAALLAAPGNSALAADAEFTVNFGTVAPEGTPWATQLQLEKKRIEEASEGRIKVRIFMSGVLGGEVEMVRDIVEGGRLQGGGFTTAAIAQGANVPMLQLPELPFLFRTAEEVDAVLDNILYEPAKKKLKRRNIFLAYWAENGWRSFFTKNKPVKTIADLREHKMRVQESEVHKAMYKALGVQASPISTAEVLDALSRGTVDGFDNTSLFAQAAGWFEPTPYLTLSKHIFQPAAIIYSKSFLEEVEAADPALRKIIEGDRVAQSKTGRDLVRGLEAELLSNFTEMGVTVYTPTEAELQPFIDACVSTHAQFADQVGADLLKAVKDELARLRAE
jgi:TRAP-type C4-dicarboxylate transport system substrate-binding protein